MKTLAIHPASRLVDSIEIATPCSKEWEEMVGDERTRFCGDCRKNVFNISSMTGPEVEELVTQTEGRVCVRLYRRHDGTVLTSDCPVGLAEKAWRRARNTAWAAAALTLTLFAGGFLALFGRTSCQIGDAQSWVRGQQMEHVAGGMEAPPMKMGEASAPQMIMGDVALPDSE